MSDAQYPVEVSASPAVPNSGTALRYILTAIGGVLVSHGFLDDQQLNTIIGGLLIVIPTVWGVYRTHMNQRKMRAMASAAPDAIAQVK